MEKAGEGAERYIGQLMYSLNDPEKAKRLKEKAEAEKRRLQELMDKIESQEKELISARAVVAGKRVSASSLRALRDMSHLAT